jgi:putative FmdB family regulatory protein
MPLHEFYCHLCGKNFEILHSGEWPNKTARGECPACRVVSYRKIYSAPKLMFKGGGFYSTDYSPSNKESRNIEGYFGNEVVKEEL